MENEDTILNKSEDPEECKINDSNKNIDKDLCLFLPKNIVEEISEKKLDTSKIEDDHQYNSSIRHPFKNSGFKNLNNHNQIEIMKNLKKNNNHNKINFINNHNSGFNNKINDDLNNLKKLNLITNIQNLTNVAGDT